MQHVDLLQLCKQLQQAARLDEASKLRVGRKEVKKVFVRMTEINPWLKSCLHAQFFFTDDGAFYDYERLLVFCLLYSAGQSKLKIALLFELMSNP